MQRHNEPINPAIPAHETWTRRDATADSSWVAPSRINDPLKTNICYAKEQQRLSMRTLPNSSRCNRVRFIMGDLHANILLLRWKVLKDLISLYFLWFFPIWEISYIHIFRSEVMHRPVTSSCDILHLNTCILADQVILSILFRNSSKWSQNLRYISMIVW